MVMDLLDHDLSHPMFTLCCASAGNGVSKVISPKRPRILKKFEQVILAGPKDEFWDQPLQVPKASPEASIKRRKLEDGSTAAETKSLKSSMSGSANKTTAMPKSVGNAKPSSKGLIKPSSDPFASLLGMQLVYSLRCLFILSHLLDTSWILAPRPSLSLQPNHLHISEDWHS